MTPRGPVWATSGTKVRNVPNVKPDGRQWRHGEPSLFLLLCCVKSVYVCFCARVCDPDAFVFLSSTCMFWLRERGCGGGGGGTEVRALREGLIRITLAERDYPQAAGRLENHAPSSATHVLGIGLNGIVLLQWNLWLRTTRKLDQMF